MQYSKRKLKKGQSNGTSKLSLYAIKEVETLYDGLLTSLQYKSNLLQFIFEEMEKVIDSERIII